MATSTTPRRAVRCALYVLKKFVFRNPALPAHYTRKMVSTYTKYDVPVAMHGTSGTILMNLLPDRRTLRLYLPIFTNIPSDEQRTTWADEVTAGAEIARLDTETKRFSMTDASPLLRLARQYGVALPQDLGNIRMRAMVKFFMSVQTAVYAPIGDALLFKNTSSDVQPGYHDMGEVDYDTFFMTSLFSQQFGTALTFPAYQVMFAQHLTFEREKATKTPHTVYINFDVTERAQANILMLNNLVGEDLAQVTALMQTPASLLRDLYPTQVNDPRLSVHA